MKRQRTQSISSRRVKPKLQRQDATVTAVVKKELRKKTDWKYTDTSAAQAASNTSGTLTSLLANLSRGDNGLDQFSGNMIKPQAITFKYFCNTNQVYNNVRVILFQWFDATAPTVATVLQTTSNIYAVLSPVLITSKPNIKILYDQTHTFAPTASGDTTILGEGIVPVQTVYIPGKRLRAVKFNASSTARSSGDLYLLHISDDSLATFPAISWYSRVTFSDD